MSILKRNEAGFLDVATIELDNNHAELKFNNS